MRFKIDENLPQDVCAALVAHGHDALSITDQRMSGAADPRIADVCLHEDRVLMTLDLDFTDIRVYPPSRFPGLIVLRLARQEKPYVMRIVDRLIAELDREPLAGRLWIVDEQGIRVHGDP